MKYVLSQGYPFVFGFSVFESFMTPEVAKSGIMPIPQKRERLIGGHAVMAIGYDNSKKAFLILNSWGPEWGLDGTFWMPYSYIIDDSFCDDFWVLREVE